jgi:amino acid permease
MEYKLWVTISAAVVAPISFLKRLDSLKYVSFVSLVGMLYLVGISVFYATVWPAGMPELGAVKLAEIVWWRHDLGKLAQLAPIIVCAFTCHPNILYVLSSLTFSAVHNELKSNTNKRMTIISATSVLIAYVATFPLTRYIDTFYTWLWQYLDTFLLPPHSPVPDSKTTSFPCTQRLWPLR